MRYWLMKSEPSEVSIDSLANMPKQTIEWFGIRNYQARNFMRDEMQVGDRVLFWHSSCKEPGIYGIAEVATAAHIDSTQLQIDNEYYDPKSSPDKPRWWCVDVKLVAKCNYVSIGELREHMELANMQVLKKGNRLSITRVTKAEWDFISNNLIKLIK